MANKPSRSSSIVSHGERDWDVVESAREPFEPRSEPHSKPQSHRTQPRCGLDTTDAESGIELESGKYERNIQQSLENR
jgi:hypothetical protein